MDKNNSSNKCALSASLSRSPTTTKIKKSKEICHTKQLCCSHITRIWIVADDNDPLDLQNQAQTHATNRTSKVILSPPIFVKSVVDFLQLRNSFIDEIGIDGFTCKSTSYHLKIQTSNPDNYRKLIHLPKGINTQYHTYQLQVDTSLRIVIRNLHSSTTITEIASEIEEIGHSVLNQCYTHPNQNTTPVVLC